MLLEFSPGAASALFLFWPAAYFTGTWAARFASRPVLTSIAYALLLLVLWVAIAMLGFTVTYTAWPSFRGHAAALIFFFPYFTLSVPIAGILLIWFAARVIRLKRSQLQ